MRSFGGCVANAQRCGTAGHVIIAPGEKVAGATVGSLYATGGVAFAEYDFKGGPNFGSPIPCCGYSDTLTGWTVGAGWEHAWTNHFTTRIEYRYTDYGKGNGNLSAPFSSVKMPTKSTTNVVRVGIGYKF